VSPLAAAVWVFWGVVVLAVVRMLLTYKRSVGSDSQVQALRSELDGLRIKARLESLEAGQLSLNNKIESAKIHPIGRRGGVFR
jgi:hypothetical protein